MTDANDIFVIGYPRSGNVWLARLLGDALNSPVMGIHAAMSIATEGDDRPGPYRVRQLHLRPSYEDCDSAVPTAWQFCIKRYNGERLVHMIRDPRDVAVSAMHYWGIKGLDKTLDCMEKGQEPLGFGDWGGFVRKWLDAPLYIPVVCYEDLHTDPIARLRDLLRKLDIACTHEDAERAVYNQSFERKRELITEGKVIHKFYNRPILLTHMRKGSTGEWREYFKRHHARRAEWMWGDLFRRLLYENNANWWQEVAE